MRSRSDKLGVFASPGRSWADGRDCPIRLFRRFRSLDGERSHSIALIGGQRLAFRPRSGRKPFPRAQTAVVSQSQRPIVNRKTGSSSRFMARPEFAIDIDHSFSVLASNFEVRSLLCERVHAGKQIPVKRMSKRDSKSGDGKATFLKLYHLRNSTIEASRRSTTSGQKNAMFTQRRKHERKQSSPLSRRLMQ